MRTKSLFKPNYQSRASHWDKDFEGCDHDLYSPCFTSGYVLVISAVVDESFQQLQGGGSKAEFSCFAGIPSRATKWDYGCKWLCRSHFTCNSSHGEVCFQRSIITSTIARSVDQLGQRDHHWRSSHDWRSFSSLYLPPPNPTQGPVILISRREEKSECSNFMACKT